MNVAHISHAAARLAICAYFKQNREAIHSRSKDKWDVDDQRVLTDDERELVSVLREFGYRWRPDQASCFSRPV